MALNLTSTRKYIISSTYWISCLKNCIHKSTIFCHAKQQYLKDFLSKGNPKRLGTRSVDVNLPLLISSQIQSGQRRHWMQHWSVFNIQLVFIPKIFSAALALNVWIFALIWSSFKSNAPSAVCGRYPFSEVVHLGTCAGISPCITCPSLSAVCQVPG